jgi:hypothetical protein
MKREIFEGKWVNETDKLIGRGIEGFALNAIFLSDRFFITRLG